MITPPQECQVLPPPAPGLLEITSSPPPPPQVALKSSIVTQKTGKSEIRTDLHRYERGRPISEAPPAHRAPASKGWGFGQLRLAIRNALPSWPCRSCGNAHAYSVATAESSSAARGGDGGDRQPMAMPCPLIASSEPLPAARGGSRDRQPMAMHMPGPLPWPDLYQ